MEPKETVEARDRLGRGFGARWTAALAAGLALGLIVVLVVWLA